MLIRICWTIVPLDDWRFPTQRKSCIHDYIHKWMIVFFILWVVFEGYLIGQGGSSESIRHVRFKKCFLGLELIVLSNNDCCELLYDVLNGWVYYRGWIHISLEVIDNWRYVYLTNWWSWDNLICCQNHELMWRRKIFTRVPWW